MHKAFVTATIEVAEGLVGKGCSITLRWTPAHKGVEGNEVADSFAKEAARGACDSVGRRILRQASLSRLTRVTTEARAQGTRD